MSQNIFPDIDPYVTSGIELAQKLNDFKAAVVSGLIGPTRPAALIKGGVWVQEEVSSDFLVVNLFDGTKDIPLLMYDKVNDSLINIGEVETADRYDVSSLVANTEFVRQNTVAQLAPLGPSVDLDTVVNNSVTSQNEGDASLVLNYPVAEDGVLVTLGSDARLTQTYLTSSANYVRSYIAGTGWGAWRKEVLATDITSAITALGKVVKGPMSSNNHRITLWDGSTGDKVKNSDVSLLGTTFSTAGEENPITFLNKLHVPYVKENITNSGATGDSAIVTLGNVSTVSLILNTLNSVGGIAFNAGDTSREFHLLNSTGKEITINHLDPVVSVDDRIFVAGEENLTVPNGGAVRLFKTSVWTCTSFGSGDASGVGGTDFLFVDTFEKAKIEDYTTTGTVSLETVNPLHGLVSMKLEHPSSGYSQFGITYPVQEKFKGKKVKLKFDMKSDAAQGKVTIGVSFDGGPIIPDLAVNIDNSQPEFYFSIPLLANTIFYRVRALDELGKVTLIDDVNIEIVKDTTLIKYLVGDEFTDGSWRHRVDGLDSDALVLEKRVSGVWEEVRRSNF